MAQPEQARESHHLEKVIYTAKAHTTGGRENGTGRSSDGRVDVTLSTPGTSGTGTNPEQLFAIGWSACFLESLKIVAGKRKIALPNDIAIDAEIDLGFDARHAWGLGARLNVHLPGIDQKTAHELVEAAEQVCTYSRVTRGNLDVAINVV